MADAGTHVLVVEHDRDLAELLKLVLDQEGYRAAWVLESVDTLAEVRQRQPHLLILDLHPQREEGLFLLDVLRANPATRGIPVLVVTTVEPLAAAAIASYNVRETLTKPFDLDDLLIKIRHALNLPPLHADMPEEVPPDGIVALAEQVLAERSRQALFRWVQRLRQEAPWREQDGLGLAQLLDSVPVLVEAIDAALHYGGPDELLRQHPEAVERVRIHTRTRRSQGISLEATVREYSLLRDELWRVLKDHLPRHVDTEELVTLERSINGALDRIIELTIPAYLEGQEHPAA